MNSRLVIGPLLPPEAVEGCVAREDRLAAARFGNERRRSEYLTWRAMLARELGRVPRIVYDDSGAPHLADETLCIAVSHSARQVAVCLSERPCAVDVESIDRRFDRVAERFMTPSERVLSPDSRLPAIVWCAKECLYKYVGGGRLDLKDDLRVESVDFARGRLVGRIGAGRPLELSMCRLGGEQVVWIF